MYGAVMRFGELPETIQTQGVCSDVEAVEVVEELMKRGLCVILPDLQPVWRFLEPALVHEFLWDVEVVAERLVEFKSWFPAADADRVVAKQAVIISRGEWTHVQGAAQALLSLFELYSAHNAHSVRSTAVIQHALIELVDSKPQHSSHTTCSQ
ncbi:hypothetical protein CEUSTIGMA_g6989.t1 [Chlamydomonas eustigma]|uniref:Uncharacterized protein n=1 Tax=Chlamydomonas eustigma TaxID=1157962 RepID=A0A250X8Z0_9CHLO|nr:hypothetical protein CEUSTIGMA_g6989.t1 [Chlamydomonas eustigma]|eukprot:GAX79548.1 hypothetical protein CEUSTIGMA_g6989.t1 [Chlamydomonas eustigma]